MWNCRGEIERRVACRVSGIHWWACRAPPCVTVLGFIGSPGCASLCAAVEPDAAVEAELAGSGEKVEKVMEGLVKCAPS